jgi:chromosome segregation ATPase
LQNVVNGQQREISELQRGNEEISLQFRHTRELEEEIKTYKGDMDQQQKQIASLRNEIAAKSDALERRKEECADKTLHKSTEAPTLGQDPNKADDYQCRSDKTGKKLQATLKKLTAERRRASTWKKRHLAYIKMPQATPGEQDALKIR